MKGVGPPRKGDVSGNSAGVDCYMVVPTCCRIASILGVVLTFQNVMCVSISTSHNPSYPHYSELITFNLYYPLAEKVNHLGEEEMLGIM